MAYQLVRLSALSGKDTGYSLIGTDLLYSTLGTGVNSLSSIKLTVNQLRDYLDDTLVSWTSAGELLYTKRTDIQVGINTPAPSMELDISGTGGIALPAGNVSSRPANVSGAIRYNSEYGQFEGYHSNYWSSLGGVIDATRDTYITADTNNSDEDKLRFYTNGTQRVIVMDNGTVGMNMTPDAGSPLLTVNGSISAHTHIYSGGDITAFSTSDIQLKKSLEPISDPLYKISQITGYAFEWNEIAEEIYDGNKTGAQYGVVAQEVEPILPPAVQDRSNGYKAVDYNQLIPLLIESVKELTTRVEELER
jgi:hypothetical protein